jgi:hypothetical protein
MKKYLTLLLTALFATTAISLAATPDKDAMMAKEKEAWQAYKDKNADAFKKLLDKDYRGVYAAGVVDLNQEVDGMQKSELKSFTISDYAAFSDEADVVVTTYKCTIQGSSGGKDTSGTFNCGSVWKSENGVWLVVFHTNVKAEAAAK